MIQVIPISKEKITTKKESGFYHKVKKLAHKHFMNCLGLVGILCATVCLKFRDNINLGCMNHVIPLIQVTAALSLSSLVSYTQQKPFISAPVGKDEKF